VPRPLRFASSLVIAAAIFALPAKALAGGGWVPDPQSGYVGIAFTDKFSNAAWDARGDSTTAAEETAMGDDLKYISLSGEIGIVDRVCLLFSVPYLYAREGQDTGSGFSDLLFGGKVSIIDGQLPLAASVVARVPWLYDRGGAYRRYDSPEDAAAHRLSNQWRGLLKYDVAFTLHASTSFLEGRGWATLEPAILFRTGAPSHALPVGAEVGYRPFDALPLDLKVFSALSLSFHDSHPSSAGDRFSASPSFDFNDASMWKIGASLLVRPWLGLIVEGGYDQWIWGRSARMYHEPFISIGWIF
jgi:hypothetical protein